MKKTFKLIWNFLKSKRLAIWLIVILIFLSAIGVLVPQKRMESQTYQQWMMENPDLVRVINRLNLNHLFHSPLFIVLGVLFLINLTTCTIELVRIISKRWRKFDKFDIDIKGLKRTKEYEIEESLGDIECNLVNSLKQKRYKLKATEDGLVVFKNKWGLWGSVICHIGLIIIIIGGLSSMMFKMYGHALIAEGQVFTETHESYRHIEEAPYFNDNHLGFKVVVKDQRIIYEENRFKMVETDVAVIKNGQIIKQHTVDPGHPFVYKGVYFYYDNHGYIPLLTLTDKMSNQVLFRSYAMFATRRLQENGDYYNEYYIDFIVPTLGLRFKGIFYPNFAIKDGEYVTKTKLLKNPVIDLEVYREDKKLYDGLLKQNQPLSIDGKQLTMGSKVMGWTGFVVSRDPGTTPIYIGFTIALIGMTMIYLINPRRLKIKLESMDDGTKIYIYGQQSKYKSELNRRINELIGEVVK